MPTEKLCSRCRAVKPADAFYRRASAKTGLMSECKECHDALQKGRADSHLARSRKHRRLLRERAVAFLGGLCAHCGIADYRVLHIDHVDGGGGAEKRAIGDAGIHRKILAGAEGYQLLCANCHNIKTWYEEEVA